MDTQECGSFEAFSCVELKKVHFEVGKAQNWKQRCADIIKPPLTEDNSLLSALIKVYVQIIYYYPFNEHDFGLAWLIIFVI